jgi:hypothetical protein
MLLRGHGFYFDNNDVLNYTGKEMLVAFLIISEIREYTSILIRESVAKEITYSCAKAKKKFCGKKNAALRRTAFLYIIKRELKFPSEFF